MAALLSRSRNITQLLKAKISFLGKLESRLPISCFHADSCYKSMAGECRSKSPELWDKSPRILAFRRYESARAGEQVEPVPDTDNEDEENQIESVVVPMRVAAGGRPPQVGLDFPGGRVTFTTQMKFISEYPEKRIPCYRVLDDEGYPIANSMYEQVNKETAVKMYENMVTLQVLDTIFYEAQRQGRISFYLTTTGEEAINIATAAALTPEDVVLPQYREPGILLWRGFTPQEFANQCFGTKNDRGKGRQMPVHYGSEKLNYFTVSSPIATQLPQAAGVAYSLKMDNKKACVVAFAGDGATSEGDFHAGLNFAAVMEAPVMFICRNNGWAISTPISEQFRSDGIVIKGQAYGIRSIRVDGNDALAVYSAIRAAREMVIREQKPILVEALSYRVGHHSTSDDSTKYRTAQEIDHWRTARGPLGRFRKWVRRNGWWTDREEDELRGRVRKQVLSAVQVADKMEKPSLTELFSDVYHEIPSNLSEQEKSLRETIRRHPQEFPVDVPV